MDEIYQFGINENEFKVLCGLDAVYQIKQIDHFYFYRTKILKQQQVNDVKKKIQGLRDVKFLTRVDFIDNNKVDREKLKDLKAPFDGFLAIVLTEFNKAIAIVLPEGFKE